MASNLLAEGRAEVLRSALGEADGAVFVVNPGASTIDDLVSVGSSLDDPPGIRLIADERTLKSVMDDFIVASNAADLVESGSLELCVLPDGDPNTLLVTADHARSLVSAGDTVAALSTDDSEFVGTAFSAYEDVWEAAERYSLRTPSLSRVRETLETDVGEAARTDFDAVLASLKTARGDGEGLDEVTISLLVAAKNDVLLYDISKWGEDVGIASKATFSRTKTRMEDLGLIDTEKVPIDVGRPRLRLKLGDDRLKGADAGELAGVAQSLLH